MKYWHIYYDKATGTYKIRGSEFDYIVFMPNVICVFKEFQMSYQYVCRMNGDAMQVSRWVSK